MRIRKKANLTPRMERCAQVLIEKPEELLGKWRESFPGYEKLYLELGCGKGTFTAATAEQNPDALFIAVEKVPDAMVMAMEKVCEQRH
jgi:tRNA (guanine-N7-)-methyltransferase